MTTTQPEPRRWTHDIDVLAAAMSPGQQERAKDSIEQARAARAEWGKVPIGDGKTGRKHRDDYYRALDTALIIAGGRK